MKFKIIFFSLLLSAFTAFTQSKTFISVKGKEMIGVDGKPFLIKGTNLGNWLVPEGYMFKFSTANSPGLINQAFTELIGPDDTKVFWKKYLDVYITQEDIHYLKSIGMNSIRVPFNYRLFTKENYMGDNDSARGFIMLDRVIKWCKAEGLYVLFDMHCAPGGQTGDNIDDSYGFPFLYEDTAAQTLTVSIWKRIAEHYKNESFILGYDLLNEPIATYFDSAHFNPKLEPLYKRIVEAIRSVDKNHLVFLGGAQWDSNFDIFGKPFDDKLVYTFHKYWTAPTREVIQSYINFSKKYDVPIYCGETGENTNEWISQFRQMLDSNNIGWHFWPYKKMDNEHCIITFKNPSKYDTIIAYANSSRRSFEEIRKARPNNDDVRQALEEFLANCRFENCTENKEYVKALGLKTVN